MGKKKYESKIVSIWDKPPVKGKNPKQNQYINLIKNHTAVFALGSSGTGKTYLASCIAADMLQDPRTGIEKIVLVREAEGPGKGIGFLKGTLEEKMGPWVAAVLEPLSERFGKGPVGRSYVDNLVKNGTIEFLPTNYSRGKTWNNCFVIIDEIQNLDWESLKNLTLRIGKDCKVVFCGDIAQQDIKGESGLAVIMRLMEEYRVPWQSVEFTIEDCVRSDIVKYTLELYEEAGV